MFPSWPPSKKKEFLYAFFFSLGETPSMLSAENNEVCGRRIEGSVKICVTKPFSPSCFTLL
jgi:hypothetical protein